MKKSLKFVDLFAGIGMARMGMEQAGFKCVYTCEFDKHKRNEYAEVNTYQLFVLEDRLRWVEKKISRRVKHD